MTNENGYTKLQEIYHNFFEDLDITFDDYLHGIQDVYAHIEFYQQLLDKK